MGLTYADIKVFSLDIKTEKNIHYENDRLGAANVIIGENNVEPLLGATALEAMNLSVDPTKNQVVKNRVAKLKYFSR